MSQTNVAVDGHAEEAVLNAVLNFSEAQWAGRQTTMQQRLNRKLFQELKANGNRVGMEIIDKRESADNVEKLLQIAGIGYMRTETNKGTIFMVAEENADKLQAVLNLDAAQRCDSSRVFDTNSIIAMAEYDPEFPFVELELSEEFDKISDIRLYQHGLVANTDTNKTYIPSSYLFNTKGRDFGTYLIDMASQMTAKDLDANYTQEKIAQIEYDQNLNKQMFAKIKSGESFALAQPLDTSYALEYHADEGILKFNVDPQVREYTKNKSEMYHEMVIDVDGLSDEELKNTIKQYSERINSGYLFTLDDFEHHNINIESPRPKFTSSKVHDFLSEDFTPYIETKAQRYSEIIATGYPNESSFKKAQMEAEMIINDLKTLDSQSAQDLHQKFLSKGLTEDDWKKFVEKESEHYKSLTDSIKYKTADKIKEEYLKEKAKQEEDFEPEPERAK